MSGPICFVDTETDGVHPGRKPWEIAIIRRQADGSEETYHEFVDIDLATSDPFGLRVGRFYERHPLGVYLSGRQGGSFAPSVSGKAESRANAALRVAQLTHGAHLVGAVPNFDAEVFDRLLRDHGLAPAWHHHLIDVEALTVGWLHAALDPTEMGELVGGLPWKSDDLSRACGVEPASDEDRHTALGDADWAMRLYDRVTRYAR